MIRASLFACAIAAAIGCRSDRQDQHVEYGGSSQQAPAPATAPSTDLGYAGDQAGAGSRASAPPADVDDESYDTETDEAGRARTSNELSSENELEPSGTVNENTGAHVHARNVPPRWTRPVHLPPPPPPPLPGPPPTPTSETASGNGTPTNTGINTENAGTGL